MKKLSCNKDDIFDVVKAVLFSIAIALVLLMAAALIMKFTALPESFLKPINIAVKIISLLAGTLLGIKHASKGALKGLAVGIFYTMVSYLLFSLINGSFTSSGITIIDAVAMTIEGIISGILVVNIKGRTAK